MMSPSDFIQGLFLIRLVRFDTVIKPQGEAPPI